jgi:hypothetical protein
MRLAGYVPRRLASSLHELIYDKLTEDKCFFCVIPN